MHQNLICSLLIIQLFICDFFINVGIPSDYLLHECRDHFWFRFSFCTGASI